MLYEFGTDHIVRTTRTFQHPVALGLFAQLLCGAWRSLSWPEAGPAPVVFDVMLRAWRLSPAW